MTTKHKNLLNEVKNHGLIIPKITPDNWVLGGLTKLKGEVINPSGSWRNYLPENEPQSTVKYESYACTCFGSNNAVETLLRFKGLNENKSDRFLAVVSGINPNQGGDPHIVCETYRKKGATAESSLPFTSDIDTVNKFYSPKPMSDALLQEGESFLERYDVNHEWVFNGGSPSEKKAKLKEALKRGTVCVSVYAWVNDGKFYYKPQGVIDNHYCMLVEYDQNDNPVVFDSYDSYLKTLTSEYDFGLGKIYYLTPSTAGVKRGLVKFISDFISYLQNLLIQKQNPPKPEPFFPEVIQPKVEIKQSKLEPFCLAIKEKEGYFLPNTGGFVTGSRSFRNRSPANFRYTELMRELGAMGKDKNNYAIFPSYAVGWEALKTFVKMASENKLKRYHDVSIKEFFEVFAPINDGNKPLEYANFVADKCNVQVGEKLKNII